MKIKYLKLKNWLLVSVMSLFGLSACNCHKQVAAPADNKDNTEHPGDMDNLARPMYGVPATDYRQQTDKPAEPKVVVQEPPREPQVTVYGVPTANFAVKGRVVDANGKPIRGVQVTLVNSNDDTEGLKNMSEQDFPPMLTPHSDTTDVHGNFEVKNTDRPWETMSIVVRDIDGTKNGKFDNQVVSVEFGDPEGGGDKWNVGVKKAEVTVKLKRKK